jgi:hypothetical protein
MFYTGTLGYRHPCLLMPPALLATQVPEHRLGLAQGGAAISFEAAEVSAGLGGTDWQCQSITEQIQIYLNIATVTAPAKVNQPCAG